MYYSNISVSKIFSSIVVKIEFLQVVLHERPVIIVQFNFFYEHIGASPDNEITYSSTSYGKLTDDLGVVIMIPFQGYHFFLMVKLQAE